MKPDERCLARWGGKQCELPHGHDSGHVVTDSPDSWVSWSGPPGWEKENHDRAQDLREEARRLDLQAMAGGCACNQCTTWRALTNDAQLFDYLSRGRDLPSGTYNLTSLPLEHPAQEAGGDE